MDKNPTTIPPEIVDHRRTLRCDQLAQSPDRPFCAQRLDHVVLDRERFAITHVCPEAQLSVEPESVHPLDREIPANGLEEVLLGWPHKIHALESDIWNATKAQRLLREQIDLKEADIKGKVSLATDKDGKPLYKNESAREGAMQQILADDSEFQALKSNLRTQDDVVAKLQRLLRRCELDLSSAKSLVISRFRGGRLEVLLG